MTDFTVYSFLEETTASGATVSQFQVAGRVHIHQTMLHLVKQTKSSNVTSDLFYRDTTRIAGGVVVTHVSGSSTLHLLKSLNVSLSMRISDC